MSFDMKYIDAERLREELQKPKTELKVGNYYLDNSEQAVGYENALIDFELLIDSLQQEQPDLPGIEEAGIPGKDYIPVEWVDACEEYGKWEIVKKEQSEGIEGVVHHYANVHYIFTNKEQLNARLKDFEEGAEVRIFINARKEE